MDGHLQTVVLPAAPIDKHHYATPLPIVLLILRGGLTVLAGHRSLALGLNIEQLSQLRFQFILIFA